MKSAANGPKTPASLTTPLLLTTPCNFAAFIDTESNGSIRYAVFKVGSKSCHSAPLCTYHIRGQFRNAGCFSSTTKEAEVISACEKARHFSKDCPDPLKDPKMEPPRYEPLTTLGKLRDYWGVPCCGSFRGSGCVRLRPYTG